LLRSICRFRAVAKAMAGIPAGSIGATFFSQSIGTEKPE
jgi:hypothetical protein